MISIIHRAIKNIISFFDRRKKVKYFYYLLMDLFIKKRKSKCFCMLSIIDYLIILIYKELFSSGLKAIDMITCFTR